ncbi:hypothetical protein ACFLKB_05875 [Clostridium sp. FAM 1755]|uniref:hypothetical protein n=1 Tax=Clostridium caseinilyticum TaxID=3350403 RepID=UPI0038F60555
MKKFAISAMLFSTILGGIFFGVGASIVDASAVFETSSNTRFLSGRDSWTRGIKHKSSVYMPYSYYYNPSYSHVAGVYTKQDGYTQSPVAGPGGTASKTGKSRPNLGGIYTKAGVRNGSWRFTYDAGHGEYR